MAAQNQTVYGQMLQKLIDDGVISPETNRKIIDQVNSVAKAKKLDLNDPKQVVQAFKGIDPSFIAQFPKEMSAWNNMLGIRSIEKNYGWEYAQYINTLTNASVTDKDFSKQLDAVKSDPKFREFWDTYKWFLQKEFNYKLDDVDKIYGFNSEDLNLDKKVAWQEYTRTIEDFDKYIWYANDDFVNKLAKQDQSFANSMQKATEAYWLKNLLGSWLQQQAARVMGADNRWIKWDITTEKNRLIDKYMTGKTRSGEDYQNKLTWFDITGRKYDRQRDTGKRDAGLDYEKGSFELNAKENEQAIAMANMEMQRQQQEALRQAISNMSASRSK